MKKGIVLSVSIIIGIIITLVPWLQVVRAAPLSESASFSSFGLQTPQEKKEAPAFSLKDLDGKEVSLGNFKGKPVLIVFWATWCDTCKEEMPVLETFSQGKRDQLMILFITIDGERKTKVQKITNQNKVTLPVLLMLEEDVMDHYGVRGWIPQVYLIDQEGMLVGKIIGPRDWASEEAWSCMKKQLSLR